MNGLIFIALVALLGSFAVWYVEGNAERLETEREINALVRESKRRDGQRRGRNPTRYGICGFAMPRLSRKERRAMWRARKSRR